MNSKKIRKIANRIRKRLEKIATSLLPGVGAHLGGLCGHGALMLHKELTELGRAPQVASGRGHWFVVCDGFLIDVTASQFGQPKVVVRDYEKVKKENGNNLYCRNWWNAESIGTPQMAGVAGFQTQIDNAFALYKGRKHQVPVSKASAATAAPSYLIYNNPCNGIAISSCTITCNGIAISSCTNINADDISQAKTPWPYDTAAEEEE